LWNDELFRFFLSIFSFLAQKSSQLFFWKNLASLQLALFFASLFLSVRLGRVSGPNPRALYTSVFWLTKEPKRKRKKMKSSSFFFPKSAREQTEKKKEKGF